MAKNDNVTIEIFGDDDDDGPLIRKHMIPKVLQLQVDGANERAGHKHIYHPSIVSIGPYHHGKEQFYQSEVIKRLFLDVFISVSGNDKSYFYTLISNEISDVRDCYEQISYDDHQLTEIMLLDACFLICLMNSSFVNRSEGYERNLNSYFGRNGLKFVYCDIWMLENQIPFGIIKLLYCHHPYEQNFRWKTLFSEKFGVDQNKVNNSFHLLHAIRFSQNSTITGSVDSDTDEQEQETIRFRSITDLIEKGIVFKRAKNREIKFTSYSLYGQLEMPILCIETWSFAMYSNIIAYEMSGAGVDDGRVEVAAYLNFLKSLIESPNDVKELREKGILRNFVDNDEAAVKLFKDIDCTWANYKILYGLKARIERHCSSKTKTWKAELINTYFRSPLTATALFGAIGLLVLAFLQTIYTIKP